MRESNMSAKTLPRVPKRPPGRLQGVPRHRPDGSRSAQDASLAGPRAPKRLPRRLQEHPGGLPDGSKSAQDASHTAPATLQRPPRAPRSLQDAATSLQDARHGPHVARLGPYVAQLRPYVPQLGLCVPRLEPTKPSCGQSLSNPTASTTMALSFSTSLQCGLLVRRRTTDH